MYSGKLGERFWNIFLWFLQGLITGGKMRGGGEGNSGNCGGLVLRLSLQGLKKGREVSKLKRCKQEGRQVQILGILWLNNNWMSPAQKFMTKPQFISMCWKEFHLVHIKSQKLNLMQKTHYWCFWYWWLVLHRAPS